MTSAAGGLLSEVNLASSPKYIGSYVRSLFLEK